MADKDTGSQSEVSQIRLKDRTNPAGNEALLDHLVELQERTGGLSRVSILEAARYAEVTPSRAFGVASFYSMLSISRPAPKLRVCDGPACWLKGGTEFQRTLHDAVKDQRAERSSCLGLCDLAPAALLDGEQVGPIDAAMAGATTGGRVIELPGYGEPRQGELRVMLANTGKLDPNSIEDAISHGAYEGLRRALSLQPAEVIAEVTASGLQGRGGAGFPVGRKWRFVAEAPRAPKYIICNADESEPLLFKDRVLIETNPHQLLEGILIGGYACGATEGWIYIRGEYKRQAERLERAIAQAESEGLIGTGILGTEFAFRIHVHKGAGAYICGEETALLESLEGQRGEPRLRPPYPPQRGFRSQPTAVNNVESFSAVASILREGSGWWRALSAYPTPGTKLYMILGHVRNPGLFEAPFGLTLRQLIDQFGGGLKPGSTFHFALCGGAAGTIVDGSLLDVPIDYGSAAKGISLGGGAFMVCDQTVAPVAFLRELLHFFAVESCGKCTPCRVGTWRALEILRRMADGKGQKGDGAELKSLAELLQVSSFCGLGQSVAIPMMSTMKHFSEDFAAAETVEPLPQLRQP
jgi:NADH:ubiquinone oxidoreductase subunit F (NADH-binding)/NADH:ubiquinone oxidoreductase subunit E